MADLLYVTADMGGNVQPMLGVAAATAALGHRVRVIGHEQLREEITAAGLDFVPYTTVRQWDSTKTQIPIAWVPMLNDSAMADDVRTECERRRPDVAIVDCLLFPAQDAVAKLGIPRVVLTHTIREYVDRTRKVRYFGASVPANLYGYRPARLWDSADLNLVTTLRDLDPARDRPQPANLEWTGPVLPPAVDAVPQNPPHMLVSLSTNGFPGQRGTLKRIIQALAHLPVQATVTTAGVFDQETFDAPDTVTVTGYADHSALLARSSLLIGHGGHSTTFRALSHGIPVLVLPASSFLDQRMIGVSLRDAGVGNVLRRSASSSTIAEATQELLSDNGLAGRVRELGARIRATDGASQAASRIDDLIQKA